MTQQEIDDQMAAVAKCIEDMGKAGEEPLKEEGEEGERDEAQTNQLEDLRIEREETKQIKGGIWRQALENF